MPINHSNPTQPRRKDGHDIWARAPYNFVSLPPIVVKANPRLPMDTFKKGLSGRIHCELVTKSTTYIRGMLQSSDYQRIRETPPDKLTEDDKKLISPFFKNPASDGPVIPGSSLRGMLRSLVEIITYSRLRWVAHDQAFFFRTVATPKEDPLAAGYRQVQNAKGGYLFEHDGEWRIRPAKLPANNFHMAHKFFQVDNDLASKVCPDLVNFRNDAFNHPGGTLPPIALPYLEILFDAADTTEVKIINNRHGERRITIRRNLVSAVGIQKEDGQFDIWKYNNPVQRQIAHEVSDQRLPYSGWILAGGNMLEYSPAHMTSRRRYHAVILSAANIPSKECPRIDPQAVRDYSDNLTEFQKDRLGSTGILQQDRPVFYLEPKPNQDVIYFGHSPNFRIPARTDAWLDQSVDGKPRASNIADFIPKAALGSSDPDMTDVIFGWTEGSLFINNEKIFDIGPKGQCKGRITVTDARCLSTENLYVSSDPQSPKILASPKPSAFPNYLCQHNPDVKQDLDHYGTEPSKTVIRGSKAYWSVGDGADFQAETEQVNAHPSRYTKIKALQPNVRFVFDVHFFQLHEEELGALLWALSIPSGDDKPHYHRLGMGKPSKMGVVKITPTLYIIDRKKRYEKLFEEDMSSWHTAEDEQKSIERYLSAFESFVLRQVAPGMARLTDVYRMKELLALTEWHENPNQTWKDMTEYQPLDDFRERPVLPDPVCVATRADSGNWAANCLAGISPATPTPPVVDAVTQLKLLDRIANASIFKIFRKGEQPCYLLKSDAFQDCFFLLPIDATNAWSYKIGDSLNIQVVEIKQRENPPKVYICSLA